MSFSNFEFLLPGDAQNGYWLAFSCSASSEASRFIKMMESKRNVCKYCDFEGKGKRTLINHILKEHPKTKEATAQKLHKCHKCDYTTPYTYNLTLHMTNNHSDEKPFKCNIVGCSKAYGNRAGLGHHQRYFHKIGIDNSKEELQCEFCDRRFAIKCFLDRHKKSVHENIRKYKCDKCVFSTDCKKLLEEHIQAIHSEVKPAIKCELCHKTFTFNSNLKRHKKSVHGDRQRYKCSFVPGCNFASYFKTDLDNHYGRVHLKEKPYSCKYCPYTASTPTLARNHEARRHLKLEMSYLCHKCDKGFFTKAELMKHQIVHKAEKDIACSQCDFKCKSVINLKQHEKSWHKEGVDDSLKCKHRDNISNEICSRMFKTRSGLMNHIRREHLEKKFICDICDYKTHRRILLQEHVDRMHQSQEKSISCQKCDYVTHFSINLKQHDRSKHQNVPREVCPICGKYFKGKKYLKTHIEQVHQDNGKFECEKCPYTTHNIRLLRHHLRKKCH